MGKFSSTCLSACFLGEIFMSSKLLGRFYFSIVSRQSARILCPRIILAMARDNVYSGCFLRLKGNSPAHEHPSFPRVSKVIGKPSVPWGLLGCPSTRCNHEMWSNPEFALWLSNPWLKFPKSESWDQFCCPGPALVNEEPGGACYLNRCVSTGVWNLREPAAGWGGYA